MKELKDLWEFKKVYEREHYKLYPNKNNCDCRYIYCKNLHKLNKKSK